MLQKAHAHVQNQRADFHHKTARTLVDTYGVIAVEDLNIKGLASGMLAKSVNDAGWSTFINKLTTKAEEAGSVCWCKSTLAAQVRPVSVAQKSARSWHNAGTSVPTVDCLPLGIMSQLNLSWRSD